MKLKLNLKKAFYFFLENFYTLYLYQQLWIVYFTKSLKIFQVPEGKKFFEGECIPEWDNIEKLFTDLVTIKILGYSFSF